MKRVIFILFIFTSCIHDTQVNTKTDSEILNEVKYFIELKGININKIQNIIDNSEYDTSKCMNLLDEYLLDKDTQIKYIFERLNVFKSSFKIDSTLGVSFIAKSRYKFVKKTTAGFGFLEYTQSYQSASTEPSLNNVEILYIHFFDKNRLRNLYIFFDINRKKESFLRIDNNQTRVFSMR